MHGPRVEEIMVPLDLYPHVHESDSLKTAIVEMESCQIPVGERRSLPRAILVFDSHEDLVGIARRRDILRGLEPEFLAGRPMKIRKALFDIAVDPNLSTLSSSQMEAGIVERSKMPIRDVMRPVGATIDHDDHYVRAIYEMVSQNVALLPVMNGRQVVGVIRSSDVLKEVAQLLLEPSEIAANCDEEE